MTAETWLVCCILRGRIWPGAIMGIWAAMAARLDVRSRSYGVRKSVGKCVVVAGGRSGKNKDLQTGTLTRLHTAEYALSDVHAEQVLLTTRAWRGWARVRTVAGILKSGRGRDAWSGG